MRPRPRCESDIEERLRAALSARAELVQPEDLAPLTPVVELRPRWQSPWVLLATAAVVLLVLGVVFQGLARDPRSDDVAPRPDEPRVELPARRRSRLGAPTTSTDPARLDLDGDGDEGEGRRSCAEPTEDVRRPRSGCETTLSSTGEEAYGIVELGTTIGTNAARPDRRRRRRRPGAGALLRRRGRRSAAAATRSSSTCATACWCRRCLRTPTCCVRGNVPVPGSGTEFYDMVRVHDYWIEDGQLLLQPVGRCLRQRQHDAWSGPRPSSWTPGEWTLDDDGVLRPETPGACGQALEAQRAVRAGRGRRPALTSRRSPTETFGIGERRGLRARATGSVPASRPRRTRASSSRATTAARSATGSRSPTRGSPRCSPRRSSPTVPRWSSRPRPTPRTSRCSCRTATGCVRCEPVGEIDLLNEGERADVADAGRRRGHRGRGRGRHLAGLGCG